MNTVLSFLGSGIFANILAVIGIVLALLPQKDTISVDNSTNYYFSPSESKSNSSSSNMEIFIASSIFFATYIAYALLQPYFVIILIFLAFALIVKYRRLKIAFRKQMILPLLLITTSALLQYTLPNEITNYWKNAYKIDFNQVGTVSQIFNQLTVPVKELFNLVFTLRTNPLSVSIFSNLIFVMFSLTFMVSDLFRKKNHIKKEKLAALIPLTIIFFIIISFMFYTNQNSPARTIVNFLTN